MRARFFAQNLRRFVNSDVIIGSISNAITLNRYAYANGNPVSLVDPLGLTADKKYKLPYDNYYSAPWEYGANEYGDVQYEDMIKYDAWAEEAYTFYDTIATSTSAMLRGMLYGFLMHL